MIAQLSWRISARLAHKKSSDKTNQSLKHKQVEFATKIHITVDGLGNPLRLCLTADQRHDITQALVLVDGFDFEPLIANRGYAAQKFVELLIEHAIEIVIPSHHRAKYERNYDNWVYRELYQQN